LAGKTNSDAEAEWWYEDVWEADPRCCGTTVQNSVGVTIANDTDIKCDSDEASMDAEGKYLHPKT
jgi:hypothetical protein